MLQGSLEHSVDRLLLLVVQAALCAIHKMLMQFLPLRLTEFTMQIGCEQLVNVVVHCNHNSGERLRV